MSPQPRKRRGLAMWLASSGTPIFVVDGRRRIVFFNAGCEQLTGWTAGDVIGQVCDFVSNPDHTQVEAVTGILCPPPEVYDGTEQTVPVMVLTRGGERLSRLIRFVPLFGDENRVERVFGTISPMPQPKTSVLTTLSHQRHAELAALRADLYKRFNVSTIVGRSSTFVRLLQQIDLARRHSGSIHFQGEPGTGKEHLARMIHYESEQRRRAFIPLDVAAMTRSDLGDTVRRVLREARDPEPTRLSPGTLYLKNAEFLPDSVQESLIEACGGVPDTRFWEQPPGRRDGDAAKFHCPVRLMSSSSAGLRAAVDDDRLSEEIYHLLTTQEIQVPPLRDRQDDFPLLGLHFLETLNRDEEEQVTDFAEDVWLAFRKYSWPGNLDELRAVITEAREACDRHTIRSSDLPFRFRAGMEAQSVGPSRPTEITPLEQKLAEVEREQIQLALDRAGNNKSQAAQLLGMTRPRLYRRMQILGLIDGEGTSDD